MKKILPLFAALAAGLSLSSWTASPEEGTTKDIRSVAILCDSYSTFENCVVQDTNAVWYYSYKQDCTDVDSVSQTWWRRFLDDTGLRLTVNNSFSGATIGYTAVIMGRTTVCLSAGDAQTRHRNAAPVPGLAPLLHAQRRDPR